MYGRATILCSYKVRPYAGQSQRDGKFENSLNFKIFLTCIGALYVENGYGYELHILCVYATYPYLPSL